MAAYAANAHRLISCVRLLKEDGTTPMRWLVSKKLLHQRQMVVPAGASVQKKLAPAHRKRRQREMGAHRYVRFFKMPMETGMVPLSALLDRRLCGSGTGSGRQGHNDNSWHARVFLR